ncbi:MAG: HD-GYP domain-containing protein [Blautia sp.]|nr:HD-GYP domain-containing protein [Blautia sp.]
MKLRHCIGYLLLSPFFVYLFSMLFYGLLSLAITNETVFNLLTSWADLFAFILSFLFANIYARSVKGADRWMMFFVYTSFYMISMVFNLVYQNDLASFVLSVLVPLFTSILTYHFLTVPLTKITKYRVLFRKSMFLLPIIGEAMLVLRVLLNIASLNDQYFSRYDDYLMLYNTFFGLAILFYIFICVGIITQDIQQIDVIREQKDRLELANQKIGRLSFEMLTALVATIEAKDPYTNGHSTRVASYSRMIATELGYSADQCDVVYSAALMHDIGKIAIPDYLLAKDTNLTPKEYEIMKKHAIMGSEILQRIDELPDLHLGALYHHERMDGSGYPYGIKGEELPAIARIISVADAYDAMSSRREYRPALDQATVRAEIQKGIGTQFCPIAARAMLDIIDRDTTYELRQV